MRKALKILLSASILILLCSANLYPQSTLTAMSYNIENAFDNIHDEGKNDLEYCPGNERKWDDKKLMRKLRGVVKVIAAADEERPLDLIGLCEVENDNVMTTLTQYTNLSRIGYKYIMTNSDDARGIDVALLYSPFTFHPFDIQHLRTTIPNHPTRDILHVAGTVSNNDTLDVYVLHLPSKLGGAAAHKRSMTVVKGLKENIDSICAERQHPNIIVMGDFNAETRSQQLKFLTQDRLLTDQTTELKPGTYKYQGNWSIIDHILTHTTTLHPTLSRILHLPFLVEKDETHGGTKPHRTYLGPIYKGGISDHLPVIVKMEVKP